MAHEFGHGTGGLADEYCQPGTYTGSASPARSTHEKHQSRDAQMEKVRQSHDAGPDRHQSDPGHRQLHRIQSGHATGRVEQ